MSPYPLANLKFQGQNESESQFSSVYLKTNLTKGLFDETKVVRSDEQENIGTN